MPRPAGIAVLGGTGFIGRHLVARLAERGHHVIAVSRQGTQRGGRPDGRRVALVQGDIMDAAHLPEMIAGVRVVVHLAHAVGGPAVAAAMAHGAELVGTAAKRAGAQLLIYASSIAALYLGDPKKVVDRATQPDPVVEARGRYAQGKIASEHALHAICRREGIPLVIVRPGLVVGPGATPFHTGIGRFKGRTDCFGWNAGRNPLPFVLVSDVAAALVATAERPSAGATYNLVGDVRPSAREYLAELALAAGEPVRFHPRSVQRLAVAGAAKWAVSKLIGRGARRLSVRELRSRGLVASFDTADEKVELGWRPVADRDRFLAEAFFDLTRPSRAKLEGRRPDDRAGR